MNKDRADRMEAIVSRLSVETDRTAKAVAQHLTDDNRRILLGVALDALGGDGNGEAIATASIWADAMRLLWRSMLVDSAMETFHYEVGYDFAATVVEKFMVTDKEYRSLRRARIEHESTRVCSPEFLVEFMDDSTPLGGRCEATSYASPTICQNIAEHLGDRRPIKMLRNAFVNAVEQTVAETKSTNESRELVAMTHAMFATVTDLDQNEKKF